MKTYSVDLTFVKSAKCSVFGWNGEAESKEDALRKAQLAALACGYPMFIKSHKFNTAVDEMTL